MCCVCCACCACSCPPQVSTCLASIAQGVHTKSRAWVARRSMQQHSLHALTQDSSPLPPAVNAPPTPFGLPSVDGIISADAVLAVPGSSVMDGLLLGLSKAMNAGERGLPVPVLGWRYCPRSCLFVSLCAALLVRSLHCSVGVGAACAAYLPLSW